MDDENEKSSNTPNPLESPGDARAALTSEGFLDGQLLIAMPAMEDERFARSVIYLCAHTNEGAMGIILNKPAEHITFSDLLEQLGIAEDADNLERIELKNDPLVHVGGPVETRRGFVLHSNDYHSEDSTLAINDHVSLTATVDILKAIAAGAGPENALLALGYAGWAPGQLESEIQANGWLHCSADPDLVFKTDFDAKYDNALGKLGIDPSFLVVDAGHA